jgi:pectinesterase
MISVGYSQAPGLLSNASDYRCNAVTSSYNQPPNIARYVVVDKYGRGEYTSVQAAIDSVPENNIQWVYIKINAAVYL